jgi:hypothetical protein
MSSQAEQEEEEEGDSQQSSSSWSSITDVPIYSYSKPPRSSLSLGNERARVVSAEDDEITQLDTTG